MFNRHHHHRFFAQFYPIARALLLVLTVSCSLSIVHADDAKEQVRQSVKALVNVPDFRMVAIYTDLQTKKRATVMLECVRPDAADLRYEQDGRVTMETIAIGHKSYVWLATERKFKEFPVDPAGVFTRMQSASLQTFNAFQSVTPVGHQTLNGEPTSVYKLDGSQGAAHSSVQIWISDDSHLPLRADATASNVVKELQNRVVKQHVTTTFTYGTSLTISPPST